ncbi:hypothetical protein Agub_g14933 [Astrephomene gubernaculifera]|uniref:Calcineurin-like phosphoesterase domain-containing protein n=1 Tax=Astrephomene gubernaculifera TaxID=47775 RepID=A0AAD3E4M1_9CHLO|nr:hypothetical protein Agub_g14933 [Astrephomene gubernaculifera]
MSYGGIPYGAVYDVRGNHDTFNSGPRCGPQDFFCRYSARAARLLGEVHDGSKDSSSNMSNSNTSSISRSQSFANMQQQWASEGGSTGRIFIDPVYDRSASKSPPTCPTVMLVGIDASLDPGMRSPTNFLGVIRQDVLNELDERLTASLTAMRAANCSPSYIAYGHYPLSVTSYVVQQSPADPKPVNNGQQSSLSSVQEVLLRHGVTAYLSGHLHGAFGRRLHRLHRSPPSSSSSSTTGIASTNAGYLVELESVDWKHGRTVRLLTVDLDPTTATDSSTSSSGGKGAVIGFADFSFQRQQKGPLDSAGAAEAAVQVSTESAGPQLVPYDKSRTMGLSYLPLMTSPPDARYSPQLRPLYDTTSANSSATNSTTEAVADEVKPSFVVRVVVLPMMANPTSVPPAPKPAAVYLLWSCGQRSPPPPAAPTAVPTASTSSSLNAPSEESRSGVLEMQLESRTANYSTYTADLFDTAVLPPSAAASAASASPSFHAPQGPYALPTSCPTGLITVRVHVIAATNVTRGAGGAAKASGAGGSGMSALDAGSPGSSDRADRVDVSTTEDRPLHWHPPPLPPASPFSLTTSSSQPSSSSSAAAAAAAAAAPAVAAVEAFDVPVPLRLSLSEWLIINVHWPTFARVAFAVQWGVVLLLLLVLPYLVVMCSEETPILTGSGCLRTFSGSGSLGLLRLFGRKQLGGQHRMQKEDEEDAAAEEEQQRKRLLQPSCRTDGSYSPCSVAPAATAAAAHMSLLRPPAAAAAVTVAGVRGAGEEAETAEECEIEEREDKEELQQEEEELRVGRQQELRQREEEEEEEEQEPLLSPLNPGCSNHGAASMRVVRQQRQRRWLWPFQRLFSLWPLRDFMALAHGYRIPYRNSSADASNGDGSSGNSNNSSNSKIINVPWVALFLYGIYLAAGGPWLVAEFISPGGYGMLTAYGTIFFTQPPSSSPPATPPPPQTRSQDHLMISNVLLLACIGPSFLLCASIASRWRDLADAGKLPGAAAATAAAAMSVVDLATAAGASNGGDDVRRVRRFGGVEQFLVKWQQQRWPWWFRLLSYRQMIAAAVIVVLNFGLCWKLQAGLGWVSVLVSPGAGWVMPLLLAWGWLAWRQMLAMSKSTPTSSAAVPRTSAVTTPLLPGRRDEVSGVAELANLGPSRRRSGLGLTR